MRTVSLVFPPLEELGKVGGFDELEERGGVNLLRVDRVYISSGESLRAGEKDSPQVSVRSIFVLTPE